MLAYVARMLVSSCKLYAEFRGVKTNKGIFLDRYSRALRDGIPFASLVICRNALFKENSPSQLVLLKKFAVDGLSANLDAEIEAVFVRHPSASMGMCKICKKISKSMGDSIRDLKGDLEWRSREWEAWMDTSMWVLNFALESGLHADTTSQVWCATVIAP